MDIERITTRGTLGPTRTGQLIPAHHCTEPVEEHRHQSGFHRRERDPLRPGAKHSIGIKGRPLRCMHLNSAEHRTAAGIDIGLTRRHPHPILEAVGHDRRRLIFVDEKDPAEFGEGQFLATLLFKGPTKQCDIHESGPYGSAVSRLFRGCEEIPGRDRLVGLNRFRKILSASAPTSLCFGHGT